jgi:hypothetical protein
MMTMMLDIMTAMRMYMMVALSRPLWGLSRPL